MFSALSLSLSLAGCYASDAEPLPGHYLTLPVLHSTNRDVFGDPSSRRDTATVELANRTDIAYYAQRKSAANLSGYLRLPVTDPRPVDIGAPPQQQYVQLDTGSFELWVNPNCSALKNAIDRRFCESVGNYDPGASSTSTQLDGSKELVYGIGSARIEYVTDDIALSGTG